MIRCYGVPIFKLNAIQLLFKLQFDWNPGPSCSKLTCYMSLVNISLKL